MEGVNEVQGKREKTRPPEGAAVEMNSHFEAGSNVLNDLTPFEWYTTASQ